MSPRALRVGAACVFCAFALLVLLGWISSGPTDREVIDWVRPDLAPGVRLVAEGPHAAALTRALGGRAIGSIADLDEDELARCDVLLLDSRVYGHALDLRRDRARIYLALARDPAFVPDAKVGRRGRGRNVALLLLRRRDEPWIALGAKGSGTGVAAPSGTGVVELIEERPLGAWVLRAPAAERSDAGMQAEAAPGLQAEVDGVAHPLTRLSHGARVSAVFALAGGPHRLAWRPAGAALEAFPVLPTGSLRDNRSLTERLAMLHALGLPDRP